MSGQGRGAGAGIFVVFEGGEGAGKSTQVRLLAQRLQQQGEEVVVTREPGGVVSAESIRELLLDPAHRGLDARAEALLFAAARAEHVAKLIRPGLERGAVVICDRFVDSSLAYQGAARGLGIDEVVRISDWATGGLTADLTIVLDVHPKLGLERAGRENAVPDRMESEPSDFHEQVRGAFLDRASADPMRYLVLDAAEDPSVLAAEIADAVRDRISAHISRAGTGGSLT